MNGEPSLPEVLSTARLSLRRYGVADSESLRTLVDKDRLHLIESFPEIAHGLSTSAESAAFVADKAAQWSAGKIFCYGIWRADSHALAGQIQAKNILWNVPSAELSYFVATHSLRLGIASEAIASLLQVLFEQLEFSRVYVRVIASNSASLALAEALGFRAEGLHRQEFRCGRGKLHDVQHLSILRSDPRPQH
jgi:RimJ/RimL family protein N-acetyltransferase